MGAPEFGMGLSEMLRWRARDVHDSATWGQLMNCPTSHARSRTLLVVTCIMLEAILAAELPAQPGKPEQPTGSVTLTPLRDGSHDFDFLRGTWRLVHGENVRPLSGFVGQNRMATGRWLARVRGDGITSAEWDAMGPDSARVSGLALMSYDPKAKQWTIRESKNGGAAEPPVVGHFEGGIGSFYGLREYAGRTMLVRIMVIVVGLDRARLERAFSTDGGSNWETHLIMHLSRGGIGPDPGRAPAQSVCCADVELLQYSVPPRAEDALIGLFDRESAAAGDSFPDRYVALFRDLDRPGVFVWVRGFYWLGEAKAFYHGPLWTARREALERMQIHADGVHELQPWRRGFILGERGAPGAAGGSPGLVIATFYGLDQRREGYHDFPAYFGQWVAPRLVDAGARLLAVFDQAYPDPWRAATSMVAGRPVPPPRTGSVSFMWFADTAAYERHKEALQRDSFWRETVLPGLARSVASPPTTWRLVPVGRSRALRASWDTPQSWETPP